MYEELVISSGGIYLVLYIGALKGLHKYFPLERFKYYTGCSAGAILSLLLVCGYSIDELYQLIQEIQIADYQEIKFANFLEEYGFDNGKKCQELLKTLLQKKGFHEHITFLELFEKTQKILTFATTNITKQCSEYHNLFSTPYMKVLHSVCMSMNVPILFKPIQYSLTYMGNFQENHYYVDGALLDPFPWRVIKKVSPFRKIGIFQYSREGLEETQQHHFMESFQYYIMRMIKTVERDMIKEKYKHFKSKNIFFISDPRIQPIDFYMSREMKRMYMNEYEEKYECYYLQRARTHYLSKKYFTLWYQKSKDKKCILLLQKL